MRDRIELLDCTLRDGAYIVNGKFGTIAIKGIIKKMQNANVDIIECGWLKNECHEEGTTFYQVPDDLKRYMSSKNKNAVYTMMIDWNKYNLDLLPEYDGETADAIRIVFPYGKHREAIAIGESIKAKGYKVYYQAANTLAYSKEDLLDLAQEINKVNPAGLSIVDTFGAMYRDDLEHIVSILDGALNQSIKLGLHSHNNQQLSFALTTHFIELNEKSNRSIIVDSSLCGMGRGAGNAPTELMVNFLNQKYSCNYDMNMVMDAIDMYMEYFQQNYKWGYSTHYFIAGMYCCHVNNIAYLQKNHRTNAKDMRNIIESLSPEQRKQYDYDLLEGLYIENQNRKVDDEITMENLEKTFSNKKVLLIAPGKSTQDEMDKIRKYIEQNNPIVIGVNAINIDYKLDYLFVINKTRYNYAKEIFPEQFAATKKILLSSIKTTPDEDEVIINFERVTKRGWEHFDNAVIDCLRLLDKLQVDSVAIAGFDGFKHKYNESYADSSLPTLNPDNKWDELNEEIQDIFDDFISTKQTNINIEFVTESIFHK